MSLVHFPPFIKFTIWIFSISLRAKIPKWLREGSGPVPWMLSTLMRHTSVVCLRIIVLLCKNMTSMVHERQVQYHICMQREQNRWRMHSRIWSSVIFHPICWTFPPFSHRYSNITRSNNRIYSSRVVWATVIQNWSFWVPISWLYWIPVSKLLLTFGGSGGFVTNIFDLISIKSLLWYYFTNWVGKDPKQEFIPTIPKIFVVCLVNTLCPFIE